MRRKSRAERERQNFLPEIQIIAHHARKLFVRAPRIRRTVSRFSLAPKSFNKS